MATVYPTQSMPPVAEPVQYFANADAPPRAALVTARGDPGLMTVDLVYWAPPGLWQPACAVPANYGATPDLPFWRPRGESTAINMNDTA